MIPSPAFRLYLCLMTLDCVNKASFIFLQSLGKPVESTLLSLIREVVLAVPLSVLLPMLFSRQCSHKGIDNKSKIYKG